MLTKTKVVVQLLSRVFFLNFFFSLFELHMYVLVFTNKSLIRQVSATQGPIKCVLWKYKGLYEKSTRFYFLMEFS